eukprot:PhM_4_TR4212/c0_g1_i1/m.34098/K13137/STRAP, UNRIP; serine-threonine kinase receptor-associated protein
MADKQQQAKVKVCSGHTRPVCHVTYSTVQDNSYWFVSSCHDGKPMLRNGETGDWVGTFEGHKGAVYCSAINSTATKVVTASGDYSCKIWNALDGTCQHTWQHPHYVKSCDWRGNQILTGNFDKNVRLFDVTAYNAAPTTFAAHATVVKAVYFTEQPNTFITASDNFIRLWDKRDLTKHTHHVEIPNLSVVEYVPTHANIILAAHKRGVAFLEPTSLREVHSVPSAEEVECASLAPGGELMALGSKLKVKEYRIDGTELESHRGHHGPVFHVRYAPDGKSFASGSEDGMVRIWPTSDLIRKSMPAASE